MVARILLALAAVTVPLAFGLAGRTWWMLPLLAAWSTVQYAFGKARAWWFAWKRHGIAGVLVALPVTYALQGLLMAVLFAFGRGIAWLVGVVPSPGPTSEDLGVLAVVAVISGIAGLLVARADLLDLPEPEDG